MIGYFSSQIATGEYTWWELLSARKPNPRKVKGKVHMGLRYNADIGRHNNAVMVSCQEDDRLAVGGPICRM